MVHAVTQELKELEKRHVQSQVVLRMEFKRGLHPFYPPDSAAGEAAMPAAADRGSVQSSHAAACQLGSMAAPEGPHRAAACLLAGAPFAYLSQLLSCFSLFPEV